MKFLRFALGILLIPACVGLSLAAADVFSLSSASLDWWRDPQVMMMIGFLAWIAVFYLLPSPVRAYVLAHELTHALWGSLMGASVKSMRVSGDSGSVTLSRANFIVTLAPYFFPLYAVLIIAAFHVAAFFRDMRPWMPAWLVLVGFAWGFHFTFTLSTLMQRQSDILRYGRVFSYTVIFLVNAASLCVWTVAVTDVRMSQLADVSLKRMGQSVRWTVAAGNWVAGRVADAISERNERPTQ
jgi:hypothetical protein